MCGRFTIAAQRERIATALPGITVGEWYGPRYNVAPSQAVPAVLNDGTHALRWIRWGLVPSWARDTAIGSRLINARSETLAEKPAFRAPLERRRCLVLADGFFEWATVPGQKAKVPYYIQLKSRSPFAFAALWDRWRDPEGQDLLSCTLITTAPNELIRSIHDRMPAILPPAHFAAWLDPRPVAVEQVRALLQPYPADAMQLHAVSTAVNRPVFDDPSCIAPVAEPGRLPGL